MHGSPNCSGSQAPSSGVRRVGLGTCPACICRVHPGDVVTLIQAASVFVGEGYSLSHQWCGRTRCTGEMACAPSARWPLEEQKGHKCRTSGTSSGSLLPALAATAARSGPTPPHISARDHCPRRRVSPAPQTPPPRFRGVSQRKGPRLPTPAPACDGKREPTLDWPLR